MDVMDGPGIVERMAEAIHRHKGGMGDDEDWKAVMGDQPRKLWKTDAPWDSNPAELTEWQRDDYRAQARAAFEVVERQLATRDQQLRLLVDVLGRVLVRVGVLQPDAPCTGSELVLVAEGYVDEANR
jgi:hypothetical protein